jgi:hypothetical protein
MPLFAYLNLLLGLGTIFVTILVPQRTSLLSSLCCDSSPTTHIQREREGEGDREREREGEGEEEGGIERTGQRKGPGQTSIRNRGSGKGEYVVMNFKGSLLIWNPEPPGGSDPVVLSHISSSVCQCPASFSSLALFHHHYQLHFITDQC